MFFAFVCVLPVRSLIFISFVQPFAACAYVRSLSASRGANVHFSLVSQISADFVRVRSPSPARSVHFNQDIVQILSIVCALVCVCVS